MQYYQEGGSEKHIRDITGMLNLSGGQIDTRYIRHWAQEFGLTAVWEAIVAKTNME